MTEASAREASAPVSPQKQNRMLLSGQGINMIGSIAHQLFFIIPFGGDKRDRIPKGTRRCAPSPPFIETRGQRLHERSLTKRKQPPFQATVSFGGDKRDRTADLLNAIQALSQAIISMPPFMSNGNDKERKLHATISMVFKNCSMLIFSVILIS